MKSIDKSFCGNYNEQDDKSTYWLLYKKNQSMSTQFAKNPDIQFAKNPDIYQCPDPQKSDPKSNDWEVGFFYVFFSGNTWPETAFHRKISSQAQNTKKSRRNLCRICEFFDMVMWHKRFLSNLSQSNTTVSGAVFILRVVHIIVLRSKAHIETSFFELLTLPVRLKTHDFLPDVKMHKIYRINFTLMWTFYNLQMSKNLLKL